MQKDQKFKAIPTTKQVPGQLRLHETLFQTNKAQTKTVQPGMVAHTCSPRAGKVKAGESEIQGHPELCSETLSQLRISSKCKEWHN